MRSHAKAPSAGPLLESLRGTSLRVAGSALLVAFALAVFASSAPAATVTERTELFSFNGSDTTAGAFAQPRKIDIDQANGIVYVIDQGSKQRLNKFNLAGQAQNFTATGQSSLATGFNFTANSDIAVDSSPVNTGRIYVSRGGGFFSTTGGPVTAFSPEGSSLWELPSSTVGAACGLAVDTEGHLWVSTGSGEVVKKYANAGGPPALLDLFSTGPPCRLAIDQSSQNIYTGVLTTGQFLKKYVNGIFDSDLTNGIAIGDITIDQSKPNGHLFLLSNQTSVLKEFDASGKELNEYPYIGEGIAYSPSLDRLYILDSVAKSVRVLGPPVTGKAPDVTIDPVQSNSLTTADFAGTINPLGLQNSYYFEYKAETSPSWSGAKKTAVESITPTDSLVHPVSASVSDLEAGKEFQVRLVAENTALKLKSYSHTLTFKSGKPAVATIDPPTEITTSTADVSGSVDPGDSEMTARFQFSSHPDCLTGKGFSNQPAKAIAANAGPTPVAEELTGLLPSQKYCVQISATNNSGESLSSIETFTTDAVAPTDLVTAFAAPRTDTTARLNGRVNPQGEDLTYRFEWSEDGGSTWNPLPGQEETSGTHQEITLSQELTGLDPSATYSYRFVVENPIGGEEGAAKTFTTRSLAEMSPPTRGFELVSNPSKGNQHVSPLPIESQETRDEQNSFPGPEGKVNALSANGEIAGWRVVAGAPDGTTGSGNPFLARRGAGGWSSQSMIPPPEKQVGGGDLKFDFIAASSDFSRSIFVASENIFVGSDVTVVRNEGGEQEPLVTFPSISFSEVVEATDVTNDTEHVVIYGSENKLLADYGSGTPEIVGLMDDDIEPACGIDESFSGSQTWIAKTDASRVYFRTRGHNCSDPIGLYVRNREEESTTLVSPNAEFLRTSPDGRTTLFLTAEALVGEDTNGHSDVYRYVEGEPRECLSCAAGIVVKNDFSAGNFVKVSKDQSHMYFFVGDRLHVLREDGSVDFVAVASMKGAQTGQPLDVPRSRLTPNGRVLLFSSTTRPTTDQANAVCPGPNSDEAGLLCVHLYRYDDADGSIECISCRPLGLTEKGWRYNGVGLALSLDGGTAAFSTEEALVPEDINGVADIYEWRNGVQRLVTDGETKFQPRTGRPKVHGIDANGDSILFGAVAGSLTGYEQDGLSNLYVARIGGGFDRPVAPVHCAEDSCQGALVPPPATQTQASSSYAGRGNLVPQVRKRQPCARKRGKGKQRCLKRQRARANVKAGRGK